MKSNKLTNHKITCPHCKVKQKLKYIKQLHDYKQIDRFSINCHSCNTNLVVYTSVDKFFSVHKAQNSRFHTMYKIKRTSKPFTRDKNKPVLTDLCYDLIQKRQSMNMTQYGASRAIGVSQATLHNWESGKTVPRAKQLKNILDFLYL